MDSNQALADRLAIYLSAYKHYVEIKSKARLLDTSIFAEPLCRDIAEIVFGYKDLVNLNLQKNYPAIDLGSAEAECAFQVTITASSAKIVDTQKKFFKHNLDRKYSKLKFIILGEKQGSYESQQIVRERGAFKFDPDKDIYDLGALFEILVQAADPAKFAAFNKRLESELSSSIRPYLFGIDRPGQNLRRLFEAHDVTPTNATSALNSYGVNREIYSNTISLNEAAGKELIQYVAKQFAVSDDWIDGQSSHIYCGGVDQEISTAWRRGLRGAYDLINRIRSNQEELDLFISAEINQLKMDKFPSNNVDVNSSSYEFFFVAARKKNDFLVERFRLVIGDPLTYQPCLDGIFLLFMAAELYEIETGYKTYVNVRVAPRDDILSCQFGDLFLVDIFRGGSLVRNHKDFIYYDGAKLIATADVPRRLAEALQNNLTEFVACRSTPLPETIEFT